jgi:ribosomal protein L40E
MAICDVCGHSADDDVVGDGEFQDAVSKGYNPFAMGVSGPALEQVISMAEISGETAYAIWRRNVENTHQSSWNVCSGCKPALDPFLERKADAPLAGAALASSLSPTVCSKCQGRNPASQWHCGHCGDIQWSLIVFSILVAFGLLIWAINIANWWGRSIVGAVSLLFLWIGVSSIRDAYRDRRHI